MKSVDRSDKLFSRWVERGGGTRWEILGELYSCEWDALLRVNIDYLHRVQCDATQRVTGVEFLQEVRRGILS